MYRANCTYDLVKVYTKENKRKRKRKNNRAKKNTATNKSFISVFIIQHHCLGVKKLRLPSGMTLCVLYFHNYLLTMTHHSQYANYS